ncbi:FCS-Like Zinc finger 5-like [Musa acuminata AAA Group]|uniref:FCS-Like Zinc finger 5-like n=1 Tax=Musa acuminata AAA Group TaxID=214697 RepID=UPI0031D2468D
MSVTHQRREMAEGKGNGMDAAALSRKRPRAPIRRTTSMKEFSAEDLAAAVEGGEGIRRRHNDFLLRERRVEAAALDAPPRSIHRRSFSDVWATTKFLMTCGLCNRRLGPGFDTFIYRGEMSFCSFECRQHKMNQDELRDKGMLESKKSDATHSTTDSQSTGDGQS